MNKYLKQLVELVQLDKEIDGFTPHIESVEKVLRATKQESEDINENIVSIDNDLVEIKSQKLKTNAHITEFLAKIKEISKKSSSLRGEKEIKAINLEEEIAKEQLEAANEEMVRLEKIEVSKIEVKKELETKKKDLEAKLIKIEADIKGEVANIEKERAAIYSKKEKLISEMNQKILTFYEKIRKWAGNTAVVPVTKQACYGCFMQINDKIFSAVIKSEDIITCPHCGRILYKDNVQAHIL